MTKNELEKTLMDPSVSTEDRLSALKKLSPASTSPEGDEWVNNHIHTTYSFSPYTPAGAVYMARQAGLSTAGIMDHDSVGGCVEFLLAGQALNMPVTVGFECRVSVENTPLYGRRLNNPDQESVAYMTLHGIPHGSLSRCEEVLAPLRAERNIRNRKMCVKINELTSPMGVSIDFDKNVLPISMYDKGGSVTERHVLFALTLALIDRFKVRASVIDAADKLCGGFSDKNRKRLADAPEELFAYDLLGILKSSLVSRIYVPADSELMHISDLCRFANEIGAISAYAYLGDVGESPTGDKKAQKFEDSYLEELFECLKSFGVNAVTYMPSRNTAAQLERVMGLCGKYGFFQISGEDINSPRQSFVCPAMKSYTHLYDATYALIGHEILASEDPENSMFSEKTVNRLPALSQRIEKYAAVGRAGT